MKDRRQALCQPDLSSRLCQFTVKRVCKTLADRLYRVWTEQFDLRFAALGTALMWAKGNKWLPLCERITMRVS